MSIRFAAPRSRRLPGRMHPVEARATLLKPANDDGPAALSDAALHAALRHFAQHGLAAARHARAHAEAARAADDRQAYAWWLAICRTLDRRMARDLDRTANGAR